MSKAFHERLRRLGYLSYADYLASDHWRQKKLEYRRSDLPQECIVCRDIRFELHHRSYARLGREQVNDFIPLCRDCHQKVHAYEALHGTGVAETHHIIRVVFGFTRHQIRCRFEPYSRLDAANGFAWVDRGEPDYIHDEKAIRKNTRYANRQKIVNRSYWVEGPSRAPQVVQSKPRDLPDSITLGGKPFPIPHRLAVDPTLRAPWE